MAQIDPALMEAAGFAGAAAGQAVGSAQNKAAINTNQLNLGGVQARRGITDAAESRGMLRSTMTNTQLGEQTAEQANKQQLVDLGLSDTIAGAQIDVMQELAQQQAQAEAQAQQRAMFDAQLALKKRELDIQTAKNGGVPDYAAASQTAGTDVNPGTAYKNWWEK